MYVCMSTTTQNTTTRCSAVRPCGNFLLRGVEHSPIARKRRTVYCDLFRSFRKLPCELCITLRSHYCHTRVRSVHSLETTKVRRGRAYIDAISVWSVTEVRLTAQRDTKALHVQLSAHTQKQRLWMCFRTFQNVKQIFQAKSWYIFLLFSLLLFPLYSLSVMLKVKQPHYSPLRLSDL